MLMLWPAIEDRFECDKLLVQKARKIYLGFQGRERSILPYVEVFMPVETQRDTFGADLNEFVVQFNIFTKRETSKRILEIMFHLHRVFKNAPLTSQNITAVQFQLSTATGPMVVDGVYQAIRVYSVIVQPVVRNPVTLE